MNETLSHLLRRSDLAKEFSSVIRKENRRMKLIGRASGALLSEVFAEEEFRSFFGSMFDLGEVSNDSFTSVARQIVIDEKKGIRVDVRERLYDTYLIDGLPDIDIAGRRKEITVKYGKDKSVSLSYGILDGRTMVKGLKFTVIGQDSRFPSHSSPRDFCKDVLGLYLSSKNPLYQKPQVSNL
jgi:hypothetical protein